MDLASSSQNEAIALIERLSSLSIKLGGGIDAKTRKEALSLSRTLTAKLEQPENVAVELAFSTFLPMCARVAVDLNLFEHIVNNPGPITASKLATLTGGEELLLVRILRTLSAAGFVEEVGEKTWKATNISRAMADDRIAAGHRMLWELLVGAASKAPKFLQEAGYRCPTDPRDGLVQYAFQTKLGTFDYLGSRPTLLRDFNKFMGNTMGARKYWVDWFPAQEQIIEGATMEYPLVIDVGGGRGHDILAFHEKHPGQGPLLLQDLPPVINSSGDLDPAIEAVAYDFFTEQPYKNARVYFYHHILHDWSDKMCLEILRHVKKAMKPGYSKLLLHEMIIPETGASNFHSMLDMTMMAFNGGMERTGRQWKELLDEAGFEILKIWVPPEDDADGIVEAMVTA